MGTQEELQLWQTAAPVEFAPQIKDRSEAQSVLIGARQGAGFPVAAGQISHALQSRASHILMDYSQAACAMRYQVDGQWEPLPPIDRETGDAMLITLKQICQMNPADRRTAQKGKCTAKLNREKFDIQVQSQGVATGERVLVKIEPEKVPFERLADLGMRDKMVQDYKTILDSESNLLLVTAPKGEGLTTTWSITLNAADRLIRDFQAFEDQLNPEAEIINVSPNFFGGDTEMTQTAMVKRMVLKEPDVLVFPDLPDPESMEIAINQTIKAEKQIYTKTVANSAVEGFAKLVARYPDSAADIAKQTSVVLCQRLVRRLCDNCKIGFEPPPALMQKLGIPPGRVSVLYQPFVPPPIEQQVDENGSPAPIEPCETCRGRGYLGRIAIFEMLTPTDALRDAVTKTQDVGRLAQIAKSEGHRGIQAEAVMTVARGLTGLDELKRAFAPKR